MKEELHKKANASSVDRQITKVNCDQDELRDCVRVLQNHCRNLESRLESLLNSRLDDQEKDQEPKMNSGEKRGSSSKITGQTHKKQKQSWGANKVTNWHGHDFSCLVVPSGLTFI